MEKKEYDNSSAFRTRTDISEITFSDFTNPLTFSNLQQHEGLIKWLQDNGLLLTEMNCPNDNCNGICKTAVRNKVPEGYTLRCRSDKNHEYSIKTWSIFFGSHLLIQDRLIFLRTFLINVSLYMGASESGVNYKKTAPTCAKKMRQLFKHYVLRTIPNDDNPEQFGGIVEIDESVFGRKIKNNKGNPRTGRKIWIVGIMERDSKKLILYPVKNRSADTLLPIIQKHVSPGSTIYTDGWRGYANLPNIGLGYKHYLVNHSNTFKAVYENAETGDIVNVDTNKIEGAWSHAKKHFR